jgi:hypothetical protein
MAEILVKKFGGMMYGADKASKDALATYDQGVYVCKLASRPSGKPTEEMRRAGQNRTMWAWLTDLERTKVESMAGTTKEQWHERLKFDYLAPIYIRDDQAYAEMFSALEVVLNSLGRAVYENLLAGIIHETSTTRATVAQFAEYLRSIEHFAHGKGVVLRTDPQIYKLIFGADS